MLEPPSRATPHSYRFTVLVMLWCAWVAVGCSERREVAVHTADGDPVAGANVRVLSLSIEGAGQLTDDRGRVTLAFDAQPARWIRVEKAGYETALVDVPERWPLTVTLVPVPDRAPE